MRKHTSLVHVEQLEMAQQLVEAMVQFKLYSTEQEKINDTVIQHVIATRQQQNQ